MTLSDIIGLKVTLNCKTHLFLAIFYKICNTYIDTFLYDGLFSSLCALYFAMCLVGISKSNCKYSGNYLQSYSCNISDYDMFTSPK